MNQNVLISTALITSLWDNHHKDTLDLMMPFLTYAIAKETSVGKKLNVDSITELFKSEFGYESIPRNVIVAMLNRLSPKTLKKQHGDYTLIVSLDEELKAFEKRRTLFKERRNEVGSCLATYLNENISGLRSPFECEAALTALITFFVGNGLVIAQTPEQLSLTRKSDNEKTDYAIARFIVEEHKKESAVFDYITDMVKGFFVSTAISFQPDNLSLQHSKFKNMRCYLDTRIIIEALGMRLRSSEKATLELLTMLHDEQATLCCFEHTVQEIRDIIKAYRKSITNPHGKNTSHTLERWDEENLNFEAVSRNLTLLETKIKNLQIEIVPTPVKKPKKIKGIKVLKYTQQLKEKIPYHSDSAYECDVLSALSVMHLRNGKFTSDVEKCGHIFITTNSPMIAVVNNCLEDGTDYVPPVVLDTTMSSVVWFKCNSSHKDYPKHKLIENAMLALEPSHTMLREFFTAVDRLLANDGITEEEAALIRSDIQIRRELVEIVSGDTSQVGENLVSQLRDRLRDRYIGENKLESDANYQLFIQQKQQNEKALSTIIEKIENAGEKRQTIVVKLLNGIICGILLVVLIALTVFAVITFVSNEDYWVGTGCLALVELLGCYDYFKSKKPIIKKLIHTIANWQARVAREKKRSEYEAIISTLTTSTKQAKGSP